jgi:hypothetical protein
MHLALNSPPQADYRSLKIYVHPPECVADYAFASVLLDSGTLECDPLFLRQVSDTKLVFRR